MIYLAISVKMGQLHPQIPSPFYLVPSLRIGRRILMPEAQLEQILKGSSQP